MAITHLPCPASQEVFPGMLMQTECREQREFLEYISFIECHCFSESEMRYRRYCISCCCPIYYTVFTGCSGWLRPVEAVHLSTNLLYKLSQVFTTWRTSNWVLCSWKPTINPQGKLAISWDLSSSQVMLLLTTNANLQKALSIQHNTFYAKNAPMLALLTESYPSMHNMPYT